MAYWLASMCLYFFLKFFFFSSCSWFLISWHCVQKSCLRGCQFSYVYWDLSYGPTCDLSWRMFHVFLKRMHILFHVECSIIFFWSKTSFKACVSLLIFYLDDLFNTSIVLKSTTIILLLSISPFMSIYICLIYWGAAMLSAYVFTIFISSSWIDPSGWCFYLSYP